MKIIFEQYDVKYTFEAKHNDLNLTECLKEFINLMKAAGFHPTKENLKQSMEAIIDE